MSDDRRDDFAATGRAGDDELLPTAQRKQSPLRALRGDILVAILVLAVGGLIVRALVSGHSTKPGVPSSTPTPAPTTQSNQLIIRPPCPIASNGRPGCTTIRSVPPAFVDAVRTVLPDVVMDRAVTQLVRATRLGTSRSIWSRTFDCHDSQTRMTIIVSAGVPTDITAVQTEESSRVVTYVRLQQEPYTVQIRAVTFARIRPALDAVIGLARDPRLVQRS